MAYVINLTNSANLTTIKDYTVDTTATNLILVGRGESNYGDSIATNFVHLLENSANTTPPPNPLRGQIWFQNSGGVSGGQLFVYDGAAWLTLATRGTGSNLTYNDIVNALGYVPGTIPTTPTPTPTPAPDIIPDAFSFTAITNATPGSYIVSNPITVSGLDTGVIANTSTSLGGTSGGWSKGGGPYVQTGTVINGDIIRVQILYTTSGTTIVNNLTIGTVTAAFTVSSTATAGTTPNAFSFTPVLNADPNTFVVSNPITVSGLGTGISAATTTDYGGLSGGGWNKNGGNFLQAGTVVNGDVVTVHILALGSGRTIINTLTIGTVSAGFSVTSATADITPDPFSFAPTQRNYSATVKWGPATTTIGNVVGSFMVSGLGPAGAPISVSGGIQPEYAIDLNQFTSVPGTVFNGQVVSIVSLAGPPGTSVYTTLTIGTVSATWQLTTNVADITPDPFSFAARTVGYTTLVFSPATTTIGNVVGNFMVSGLGPAGAPISISGGIQAKYAIDLNQFTAVPGTVFNGQVVTIVSRPAPSGNSTFTTLVIGTYSATWQLITS